MTSQHPTITRPEDLDTAPIGVVYKDVNGDHKYRLNTHQWAYVKITELDDAEGTSRFFIDEAPSDYLPLTPIDNDIDNRDAEPDKSADTEYVTIPPFPRVIATEDDTTNAPAGTVYCDATGNDFFVDPWGGLCTTNDEMGPMFPTYPLTFADKKPGE